MKVRSPGLAWSLWGVTMALEGAAIWLSVGNYDRGGGYFAPQLFVVPGFATVGAVIVARRANAVGWLCGSLGLLAAAHAFSMAYAVRDRLLGPGTLPAGSLAGALEGWLWPLNYTLLGLFLLLFPDGRLPSPRWQPVARIFLVLWSLAIVLNMLESSVGSPLRVPAQLRPVVHQLGPVVAVAALVSLAVTAAAPFLRFRQAVYQQRQQLKWVAFAVTVSLASVVAGLGLEYLLPGVRVLQFLGVVGVVGVVAGIPVAVGMAVLRHGLYDIDRLIKRTLVYGLLTAVLGLVYASLALVLGQLVGGLGSEPPSWAVAAATLTVAALFRPARHRIQVAVDRRFNRRTYDAATTLEAFSVRLRNEINFDTLSAELRDVISQTMQPTQTWVWLRPFDGGSRENRRGPVLERVRASTSTASR